MCHSREGAGGDGQAECPSERRPTGHRAGARSLLLPSSENSHYRSKASGRAGGLILRADVRQRFKTEKEDILMDCCVSAACTGVLCKSDTTQR